MNTDVPTGAQACACPPASHEERVVLLEVLPHRYKPGLRALLSAPEPGQPGLGHIFLREDWLASVAGLLGMGPSWTRPGEPIPIRVGAEYDDRLGPRIVIAASDRPTPAQAAADAELRRALEEQGRWRRARAPDKIRQLFAIVPEGGGPRWEALALQLQDLDERRIVHLAVRPVNLDDPDAVHEALRDAGEYVHWTGADAVLIVTGDRHVGSRVFSEPRVVEAACDLGAALLTLAGPVSTPIDDLAWHSSPVPGAVQAAIERILRGELEKADRPRLDRIEELLIRSRIPPGDGWPSDAPF
ncbi:MULTISPECIES: hypothetical protein [unclassified Methylobacterium]|jgi:hypothetical protein|uniref:hypothetical protein n=1 Tax=unclassified Methylobacterium TaxID=2615210 RepID=UPI001353E4C2|nr:hypothetical protein [Methylobacterium sp. 2A]MWV25198.1 hypothetical protein [Methylobacterium sp. 2A]